jgi:hypothetical protein
MLKLSCFFVDGICQALYYQGIRHFELARILGSSAGEEVMRCLASRRSAFFVAAALLITSQVHAENWTGLAAPDNSWTNAGNWDLGVPGSSSNAFFNSAGNGNTTVSLGGATQAVGSIFFDPGAAAYTLGVLSAGDTFDVLSGGSITLNSGVANPHRRTRHDHRQLVPQQQQRCHSWPADQRQHHRPDRTIDEQHRAQHRDAD